MTSKKEKERPGILIYKTVHESLLQLEDDEIGRIIRDWYSFTYEGVEPHPYEDRTLRMIWGTIRSHDLDDRWKYAEKVTKNRYATYCRDMKRRDMESEIVPFEQFKILSENSVPIFGSELTQEEDCNL